MLALQGARTLEGYHPRRAWHLPAVYFCACLLISWAGGVLKTLTRAPWITPENADSPGWWAFTGVCLAVILIGYIVI